METNEKEEMMEEVNKTSEHKHILIFNVTGPSTDMNAQTNFLINKMNKYAKDNQIDVTIRMESASQIGKKGEEADIILLTPELFAMLDEVSSKYPNKIVKVINQEDYGYLHGEEVLKAALL